tara:strand:- start:2624 stop:2932 length:309 start_codon:yes stop_codon:yes gene_type:complete
MKREIKQMLKKSETLVSQISQEYMNLDMESDFSTDHHDTMLIQKDAAYQELEDFRYLVEEKKTATAKDGKYYVDVFTKTLKYMKAVIRIQEQVNKLPEMVFG